MDLLNSILIGLLNIAIILCGVQFARNQKKMEEFKKRIETLEKRNKNQGKE